MGVRAGCVFVEFLWAESSNGKFEVLRECWLPSDHAPIAVTMTLPGHNIDNLNRRAGYLGDHAVLYNNINS